MSKLIYSLLFSTFFAKDSLRVENSHLFISEGNAACKTHLRNSEEDLLLHLGSPERRNYARPEILEYDFSAYTCRFLLRNGTIVEICLLLRPKKERNVSWSSESKLYEEDLVGLSEAELIQKLFAHYQEKPFQESERITFFKKGISFNFYRGEITMICVFPPKKRMR